MISIDNILESPTPPSGIKEWKEVLDYIAHCHKVEAKLEARLLYACNFGETPWLDCNGDWSWPLMNDKKALLELRKEGVRI
jgi:hypothetical protein